MKIFKKAFVLIFVITIICMTLCACSSSGNEYSIEGICDICGKSSKLKSCGYCLPENNEIIPHEVCKNCWEIEIPAYEDDITIYMEIVQKIQKALEDDNVYNSIVANEDVMIYFDKDGVKVENDLLEAKIMHYNSYIKETKSNPRSYTIEVDTKDRGTIHELNRPKDPLEQIK